MDIKYFYQRQKTDYWRKPEFRGLRQQPNGEALSRIYNDMELQSVEAHGYIYNNTPFPLQKQIALAVEADEKLVAEALDYFKACGWIIEADDNALYFPRVVENTSLSASRTRDADRKESKRREEAEETKSGNFPQNDGIFPHSIVNTNSEQNNNICKSRVEGESEREPPPSDEMISAEFNSLWGLYPEPKRSESSKHFALAAYNAARRDGTSVDVIRHALERYVKDTPPRYLKKASKWFEDNAWKDTGTASNTPPPSKNPPPSSEKILERQRQNAKEGAGCATTESHASENGEQKKTCDIPPLGKIDALIAQEELHITTPELCRQLRDNGLVYDGKVFADWPEIARAMDKAHRSSMK